MSFKNQAEIYQALLDGKTIIHKDYKNNIRIAEDGNLNNGGWGFNKPSDWSIFIEPKPKKTIEFFECVMTYGFGSKLEWLSEMQMVNNENIMCKTGQSRIVEIDE
jgi:hypothetical protein